jgi:hypothetical protein
MRLTGARASSLLPSRDTPTVIQPGPDGLSRTAAEAAGHAVTPSIAGTPHVRISRDGGRTYPARHARPLPAASPGQPCTVPVYDPGTGSGRLLTLDLDPGRPKISGQVEHQAAALGQLLGRLGGRCIALEDLLSRPSVAGYGGTTIRANTGHQRRTSRRGAPSGSHSACTPLPPR